MKKFLWSVIIVMFVLFGKIYCDSKELFFPCEIYRLAGVDTVEYNNFYFPNVRMLDRDNIFIPAQITIGNKKEIPSMKGWRRQILRTSDGGKNWDSLKISNTYIDFQSSGNKEPVGYDDIVLFSQNKYKLLSYNSALASTEDGGKTWDSILVYPAIFSETKSAGRFTWFADTNNAVMSHSYKNDQLYYTTDGGKIWNPVGQSDPNNLDYGPVWNVVYNKSKNKLIGAQRRYSLLHATFNSYENFKSRPAIYDLEKKEWFYSKDTISDLLRGFYMIDDSIGFAVGDKVYNYDPNNPYKQNPPVAVIYKTTNGGKKWDKIIEADSSLTLSHYWPIVYKDGRLFATMYSGFMYSDDLGETWKTKNFQGVFTLYSAAIFPISKNEFIIRDTRSDLWLYKMNELDVQDNEEKENISIYPNPTNGICTFKSNSIIDRIEIYDINGQKIIELAGDSNNIMTIDFGGLSTGIYFAKIYSDSKITVEKIVNNK